MLVLPTPVAPKNAALRGPCSHGGSAPPSRVIRYAEMHLFCICSSISIEIFVVLARVGVVDDALPCCAFAVDPLMPAPIVFCVVAVAVAVAAVVAVFAQSPT